MALLPIRRWPDPVLQAPAALVTDLTPQIRALAADMLETMYAAPGRGLAAPQVGVSQRLFVMDVAWKDGAPDPHVVLNPVILWRSPTQVEGEERCLSLPGIAATVARAQAVRLRWMGLDGGPHEAEFAGFAAICIQHEYDHLDGIVTLDRLAPQARAAALDEPWP